MTLVFFEIFVVEKSVKQKLILELPKSEVLLHAHMMNMLNKIVLCFSKILCTLPVLEDTVTFRFAWALFYSRNHELGILTKKKCRGCPEKNICKSLYLLLPKSKLNKIKGIL